MPASSIGEAAKAGVRHVSGPSTAGDGVPPVVLGDPQAARGQLRVACLSDTRYAIASAAAAM